MRKQYHFRHSDRGLLAWDVHRLIELSCDLPRRPIALSAIAEVDEVYWFDGEGETPTCRKLLLHMALIDEADLSYPVILCAGGRVMDGMHRVMKALKQGFEEIETVQFERDPDPDFVGRRPQDLPYQT